MVTWAFKRRWTYLGIFIAVYLTVSLFVYFVYFYKPATCSDGKKNGDEMGIDCGGSCVRLCQNQNINPIVRWSRAFEISPQTYSLVAYVENPNFDSGAASVPYVFKVYDDKQQIILEKRGLTSIPVAKIFAIYEGPLKIDGNVKNISFEFERDAVWKKASRIDTFLKSTRIRMTQEQPYPRIDASLENTSLSRVNNVEAVAIVYGDDGNAFAVSRTFVDTIDKESYKDIVFTWQKPFTEQFASCEVPSSISVVIDRSGSMEFDSKNPPQPLTSVKEAAKDFISLLGSNNTVSVVSFANTASIDQINTSDVYSTINAIDNINIKTGSLQQTNIGDALIKAGESLSDSPHKKVIVLLTDGVPTEPTKSGIKDYPMIFSKEQADLLLAQGFEIHTIGFGNSVDDTLLQSLSSGLGNFYKAITIDEVIAIYEKISKSLCKKNPTIEVIPRIYPQ